MLKSVSHWRTVFFFRITKYGYCHSATWLGNVPTVHLFDLLRRDDMRHSSVGTPSSVLARQCACYNTCSARLPISKLWSCTVYSGARCGEQLAACLLELEYLFLALGSAPELLCLKSLVCFYTASCFCVHLTFWIEHCSSHRTYCPLKT